MNNLTHSAIIKDKLANFGHKIIHKIDHAVSKMVDEQVPTLENPVKFKVCHRGGALVREGYDTTTPQVHQLNYGEIVAIVELVGRRARMIQPVYGWVSLRTKDGVKILEQKQFQGKVSVRGDKGFEKAFDERFQKVRSEQLQMEHERKKQMEDREEGMQRSSASNGGPGSSFDGGFANFDASPPNANLTSTEPDLLGGEDEDIPSPSAKPKFLDAPREFGNAPIPRLGAPSDAPIMAPAKKKPADFSLGGGFGEGRSTGGGGGLDLLGDSGGGNPFAHDNSDFFGAPKVVPSAGAATAARKSPEGGSAGTDLLSGAQADFFGSGPTGLAASSNGSPPRTSPPDLFGDGSINSDFGGNFATHFPAAAAGGRGSPPQQLQAPVDLLGGGGPSEDLFGGQGSSSSATAFSSGFADFGAAPVGFGGGGGFSSAGGGVDLLGEDSGFGVRAASPPIPIPGGKQGQIVLTNREAENKSKEKSNDIDLDLFG